MTSITRFLSALGVVALALVVSACGKGSTTPTSPSPGPAPLPGAGTITVPIPNAPSGTPPAEVWFLSVVREGNIFTAKFTIVGPVGYTAFISTSFMNGDAVLTGESNLCRISGGSVEVLGPKPTSTLWHIYQMPEGSPKPTHILVRVWVKPNGGQFPACGQGFTHPVP